MSRRDNAGGRFGEISELYVNPAARSGGVTPRLPRAAVGFAGAGNRDRLEVGAPDVPRWNRTVAFYRRNGFVEVGPGLTLIL